ncbi:MAG: hypothetical protein HGA54_09300, partial [Actinobacteria bacterium]|nr:hypothetical protein [Actinomycetota bacterium]
MNMVKRFSFLVCMFALAWATCAAPAFAVSPITLSSAYITDQASVLSSSDTDEAENALEKFNDDTGVQLFVVYVDSFDGIGSQDWTDETAVVNGLGLNDILLAVAIEDHQYAWSVDEDFPLTDSQLNQVAADYIEPMLQSGDWAGAAIAATEGYQAALDGESGEPAASPTTVTSASSSSSAWILPLILIIAFVAIAAFIFIRRRRSKGTTTSSAQPAELSTKELETRAGKLLVEVDDAVQSSEQELGFAEAEFGADAIKEYSAVLETAKKNIAEAFHLQQSVYDSTPEDENTKRGMLMKIIELASSADASLDEKAEGFAQLRALAERVGEVITAVSQRITACEDKLEAASKTLTDLKASYLPSALGEVADDDAQAKELLGFARKALEEAQAANSKGDKSGAAVSVRSAENADAQAERLLAAITTARDNLAKATATLEAEITQLEQAATSAESRGGSELVSSAKAARDAASQARAALTSPPFDPLVQLNGLRAAMTRLTSVLDASEHAKAAYATSQATIASARDRIGAVESFIATRRGAVGSEARSGLQEAKT